MACTIYPKLWYLMLLLLVLSNTKVKAFYLPFGEPQDSLLPECDDCVSDEVSLGTDVVHYYGDQYSSVWVNTNNWILLGDSTSGLWGFDAGSGYASIGTHGMDYSLKSAGTGYYRGMTRNSNNENQFLRVENLLNLFSGVTVTANWMFVLTYDMAPYWQGPLNEGFGVSRACVPSSSRPTPGPGYLYNCTVETAENSVNGRVTEWGFSLTANGGLQWSRKLTLQPTSPCSANRLQLNSWQAVLVASGTESYVLFNWEDMQRSYSHEGVGFHKGDGSSTVELTIPDYLALHTTEYNVDGCPGLRAFRVDTDPPTELSPQIAEPPAVTPFLSAVTTFTVTPNADSSKLTVSFTPDASTLPAPPAAIVVQTEYELTNRDQCEAIACTLTPSNMSPEHSPCTNSGSGTWIPTDVSNLEPNSDYTVSVFATDQCGNLVDSDTVLTDTATTAEAAPDAPPDNVMASVVGCDSATFTWDDVPCGDRNGVITGYDYIVFDSSSMSVDNGNTASQTVTLSSLMPGMMYTFTVRAKTASTPGDGPYEDPAVPFQTASASPPDAVTGLTITPDETQLSVSWTASTHPLPSCPIPLDYLVEYELNNIGQCQDIADPMRMTFITTSDVTVDITGLEPYSSYTVYITPTLGTVYGAVASDNDDTLEAGPIAPDGVSNEDLQCTSATFTWNPLVCGDRHGIIINYNYALYDEGDNLIDSGDILSADPTTIEIVDLMPATTYEFAVASTSGAGQGPFSDTLTVMTLSAKPNPVQSLTATPNQSNSSSILVEWDEPVPNQCAFITGYRVEYRLAYRDQCQYVVYPIQVNYVTTLDLAVEIKALEPHSTYDIFVTVETIDDESIIAAVNATTVEAVPTATPTDPASLEIHETSVSFCWKNIPCGSRNGEIIDYVYEVYDESGALVSSTSVGSFSPPPKEATVIRDLIPCSGYTFHVAGLNNAGEGPYSANVSVTTASSLLLSAVEDLSAVAGDSASTVLRVSWIYPMITRCPVEFLVEYELVNREQCEIGCPMIKEQYAIVSSLSVTIELLEEFSTYRVFVTPLTEVGIGPVRFATATTGEGVPLQPPRDVISTEVGSTYIIINVNKPIPCGDRNGEITSYSYILIGRTTFQRGQGSEVTRGIIDFKMNDESSRMISNLKPCSTYELRIAAGTSSGYGEYVSIPVSTDGTVPAAVNDLTSSISHTNVAEVSWNYQTTPANPCRATVFNVDYKVLETSQCNTSTSGRVEYKQTSEMSVTINDILPDANYQIWVTAANSVGKSQEMIIIISSNAVAPIGSPQNVVSLETAKNRVVFSWEEVTCKLVRGIFVSYAYELIDLTDTSLDQNGNVIETSVTLTLDPDINYSFRVAVVNVFGMGPFSDDIVILSSPVDNTHTLVISLISSITGIIMIVVIGLACLCLVRHRRRRSIAKTTSPPAIIPFELRGMTPAGLYEQSFRPWSITMNEDQDGVYY